MPKKSYGKTKSGVEITDELIEQYVTEAEQGYDLDKLKVRRGRPLLGRAPAATFAVRLDPDLRTALDERAKNDGVSGAEVIRRALRQHLGVRRPDDA
jgi:CRISPR-associated endonuclease/helicase Cas3